MYYNFREIFFIYVIFSSKEHILFVTRVFPCSVKPIRMSLDSIVKVLRCPGIYVVFMIIPKLGYILKILISDPKMLALSLQ